MESDDREDFNDYFCLYNFQFLLVLSCYTLLWNNNMIFKHIKDIMKI